MGRSGGAFQTRTVVHRPRADNRVHRCVDRRRDGLCAARRVRPGAQAPAARPRLLCRPRPAHHYVSALGEIGNTYVQQGAPEAALPYYQKAITAANDANLPEPAALWAGNLAAAQTDLGRWDDAERFNEEAKRLNETINRAESIVYNNLNTAQIARGRGRLDDAARLFNDVLRHESVEVAFAGRRMRGWPTSRSRDRSPRRRGIISKPRWRNRENARGSAQDRIPDLVSDPSDPVLSGLRRRARRPGPVERALEIADSFRGRVLAERHRVAAPLQTRTPALRQFAARSRTVLLSYWLAPKRSYLWVVTGSRRAQDLTCRPRGEIEAAVRDYRALIDNSLADPLARAGTAGDRLYQLLIAPAADPAGRARGRRGRRRAAWAELRNAAGRRRHAGTTGLKTPRFRSRRRCRCSRRRGRVPPAIAGLLLIGNPTPRAPDSRRSATPRPK